MFRTAREFASPGIPLPRPLPQGDIHHGPLHGEIPEENRIWSIILESLHYPRGMPGLPGSTLIVSPG